MAYGLQTFRNVTIVMNDGIVLKFGYVTVTPQGAWCSERGEEDLFLDKKEIAEIKGET